MRKVAKYEALDGKIFDHESGCRAYEGAFGHADFTVRYLAPAVGSRRYARDLCLHERNIRDVWTKPWWEVAK